MKTNKQKATQQVATIGIIALAAIIVFAFIACGGDDPAPETFTVTFNANGGSPTPEPQLVEKGKTATEPQGVTKANHTLDGWYKEEALTTKWNFASDTVTANITLWAKWVSDGLCHCEEGTTHEPDENCCEGTDCTCPIAQPFTIGSVSFVFEFSKDDTTSWTKLNTAVQTYATFIINNTDSDEAEAIDHLSSRTDLKYRIIVDYSDEGKADGFTATDAQTLKVGSDYLANTNLLRATLKNAFQAMYAKPYPIPKHYSEKTLHFPTTENPDNTYSVTITSNDTFTAAEWNTLCDDVVTALEAAYENGNGAAKNRFRNVFGQDGGVTIVLENNPTEYTNYKVGTDFKVLYLNVDNIASINYASAMAAMNAKDPDSSLNKG